MNLPSFVIHNDSCVERYDLVKALKEKTNAVVFDAVMLENGKDGCRKSHIEVARFAKVSYPNSRYIVFEDDCVLSEDWEDVIEVSQDIDVVFIGVNDLCDDIIFGTHALILSPKARDVIVEKTEECCSLVSNTGAFDHILSYLIRKYNLSVKIYRLAMQQEGLRSLITGEFRSKHFLYT